MSDFFVRKGGSNSNAGTSAGAAWLTITKALSAAAGPTGGDTIYVGAGTYRELVPCNLTSPTSELRVIADVDGAKTGDAGRVVSSAYLTNDTTLPTTHNISLLAKNFLTFENFYFSGGNNYIIDGVNNLGPHDITFRRCVFVSGSQFQGGIGLIGIAGVASNWTIDSCHFFSRNQGIAIFPSFPTHSADYDVTFVVKNCTFTGGWGIYATTSGALGGLPNGIVVLNSSFAFMDTYSVRLNNTNFATSITSKVYGCHFLGGASGVSAGAASQLVEDYNLIQVDTARTNVTAGSNSIATFAYAPLLDGGYSRLIGMQARGALEPLPGAPELGFDPLAGGTGYTSPTAPTTDILNRPRPAGGALVRSVGAYELHDTAVKETTVTDAGTGALKITGPGDHDFRVPVNASATVLSVRVRYDTNHGTTNKPQAILLANGEIGVTTETKTATVAVDTWETLTFASQTPSAKGSVVIRLVSRAAAASGIAYFDTMVAPDIDLGDFGHFSRGEPGAQVSGAGAGGSSGVKVHPGMSGGPRG